MKRKKQMITSIVGTSILLTSALCVGCGPAKVAAASASTTMAVEETTSETVMQTVDTSIYDNKEILPYDGTPVSMGLDAFMAFNDYLNTVNVNYEYEEFYGIDEALNKQSSTPFVKSETHSHSIELKDGKFDAEAMVDVVLNNNQAYLESDEVSDFKKSTYSELTRSEIANLSSVIADTLNAEIERNPSIDIEELKCVVGNLKMFSSISTSNAYVNMDDCLAISPNMIDIASIINSDNENVERDIIVHESMHLIQKTCADNQKDVEVIGISHSYEDLDVNPLKWLWFLEGSAEKEMCNITGDEAITYKYKISYLDSLTMATMLRDGVSADQTEKICFQNDPEILYQQFGCENDDEKCELIKMMYTTDILQSEREDFYEKYEPVYGAVDNEEQLVPLQRELKVPICETLTKEFYENLGSYMSSGSITIDDMNYLIRVFEGDVNSHLDCANIEKAEENIEFMNVYIPIQDEFFKAVADSTDYSYEDLLERYNKYVPDEVPELLNGIDMGKKEFAIYRMNDVGDRAKYNMREMKEMVSVKPNTP
ncbi:MAG: hypothetical protein EOM34_16800 [Clostridia bacterium]|nr:hypothetical protein [Lachnospiraceae bacterium]NCC02278.1 hypothetical protein [Clostridia bacterium]NCD03917.1 hypothetical protein [Clostridia bacterium]